MSAITVPVVFNIDENYVQHLCCVIASILKNAKSDETFNFYIINSELSDNSKNKINSMKKSGKCTIDFIHVDKESVKDCPLTKEAAHITAATYFRFMLPDLLPDIDKVLYLDCDITVLTSLRELYETNIDNYYFAGCKDCLFKENAARLNLEKYCNTGVMLANLAKWRRNNISAKLFEYAANNSDKIVWVDQDVLNVVMQNSILYLEQKWNLMIGGFYCAPNIPEWVERAKAGNCIIHHAGGIKPWNVCYSPLRGAYFKYLIFAPYKNKIIPILFKYLLADFNVLRKNLIRMRLSGEKKYIKICGRIIWEMPTNQ